MRIRQFKYKAQLLTKGHVEINKRHVNTNSFSKFPFFFFFFFRPVHIVYTCVLIMCPLAFIMLIVLETEEEKKIKN